MKLKIDELQSAFFAKQQERQQMRFKTALSAEILAKMQSVSDYLEISNKLFEWEKKAEPGANKKKLLSMIMALWRIQAYCENLETVSKRAITEMMETNEKCLKLEVQSEKDRKEIDQLKAEIQFIQSK